MRDAALPFMDCYQALFGLQKTDEASAVFAQLEILALQDAELAERLAQWR